MAQRGRPRLNQDVEAMTSEELELAAQRVEGKTSPFANQPLKAARPEVYQTDDGRQMKRVGDFSKPVQVGSSPTLKRFARIPISYKGWIEMTDDDAIEYQKQGILVGHDSEKKLGLLANHDSKCRCGVCLGGNENEE